MTKPREIEQIVYEVRTNGATVAKEPTLFKAASARETIPAPTVIVKVTITPHGRHIERTL